jgi:predicted negative regulator of RcsB-dependent stress response
LDAAAAALRSARAAAPDESFRRRALESLILLLIRAGQRDQADALLAAQPAEWRWLHLRGDLAVQRGDLAAAADHYSAALTDLDARLSLRIRAPSPPTSIFSFTASAPPSFGGCAALKTPAAI